MKERMFENMSMYFPSVARQAVDYYEDGPDMLLIKTDDGRVFSYDDMDRSIRRVFYTSDDMTEDDCRYEFGMRLRKLMMHKRVTQSELSEKTGLSQPLISNYMTGRNTPSFYNVDKIVKALGCSVDDLRYKG